jgi:hypothetical protein
MGKKVIVIGAGVSGITTALTLQLLGYKTEIITHKTVSDVSQKNSLPEFASLFPSASVIPHSVYSDQLEDLFRRSQSIFYELRKLTFAGVTIHKHYEVFEFEPERPQYTHWMLNLQSIGNVEPNTIPRRPEDKELHGWVFDCIFADWSLYLPALYERYKEADGTVTQQKLKKDDISDLPAEIIINCSGTGGPKLFEDPSKEQLLLRGHLLHKSNAPLITNANNEIISYNYTPQASVYADPQGNACDVYCYPRKDGWVLGGSRQPTQLSDSNWETLDNSSTYSVDEISFPRQIIDLNNEILQHSYGHSVDLSDDLTLSLGYRYIRNRKNGLRLEQEKQTEKTVIHNYGHGGAGVTLSWGCALKVAHKVSNRDIGELQEELLENLNDPEIVNSSKT